MSYFEVFATNITVLQDNIDNDEFLQGAYDVSICPLGTSVEVRDVEGYVVTSLDLEEASLESLQSFKEAEDAKFVAALRSR